MRASTIVLLPDQFSDPIRIIRVDDKGARDERYGSLTEIRTGEDGTDHPSIRRYETIDTPTAHLTDLVNSRMVITDAGSVPPTDNVELPAWARRNTALHPDRHDLASWLDAANRDPSAPWVAHLAITVRDALRDKAEHHPAVIAFPDRAFLAASGDNAHPAMQAIIDTFTIPAHEIDKHGHRNDKSLAPMALAKVSEDDHRTAIITRAQAVISEALVNAVDAKPQPTADDLHSRWTDIVGDDHAQRLRLGPDGVYSAPVAILDDHNNARFTATFVLATLKITLGKEQNDIWFEYHNAYDIDASRPFDINIAKTSLLRQGDRTKDQQDMLDALNEQAIPVLELSTTPSGEFANRDLISSIPDSSPLLRDHPGFTFPDAILAYLMFRDPGTFEAWWQKLMRRRENADAQGGEDLQDNGAEGDEEVAISAMPPEPASKEGETDKDAPVSDAQSDDTGDEDQTDENGGDTNDADTTEKQPDESGDQGPLDDSGQARLDPESEAPSETEQAKAVADAIAGDDAGDDGEIDMFGAGSDSKVADSTEPSNKDDGAEIDETGSETGDALETNTGSEELNLDTVSGFLAAMSDSDQATVRKIRSEVARQRKAKTTRVIEDEKFRADLDERPEFYEKVWSRLTGLFKTAKAKHDDAVQLCLFADALWLRHLFLLNLYDKLVAKTATSHTAATKDEARASAVLTLAQAEVAKIALPAIPSSGTSNDMGGGNA